MRDWTTDRIGDAITIGMLCVALIIASFLSVKRTWRWERLGIALSILMGGIAVLFGIAEFSVIFDGGSWILRTRWGLRTFLTFIALWASAIMLSDKPSGRPNAPPLTISSEDRRRMFGAFAAIIAIALIIIAMILIGRWTGYLHTGF